MVNEIEKTENVVIEELHPTVETTEGEIASSFLEDVQAASDAGILDGQTPIKPEERNIIYVGEGEPATEYHGAFKVSLPDAETQKRGFYHPEARQIINQLPKKYKKFIRKGEK